MRNGSRRLWLSLAAMRRFMLAAALAALGTAVVASPAFAFDHHFNVVSGKGTIKQVGPHLFQNKERLVDPNNHHDKVGSLRGPCREKSGHFNCHFVVHLNGEIGGLGNLKLKGDLDPGSDRLAVVGGSGQFHGVTGKFADYGGKYHLDLVR